ncbi:GTP pyrophosphokinase [Dactylosporangium darangshiense]|uniref:GTP pyrophosphokinase family protein n=1 Tax=Dactylosporangium darangshiense TaxID=579108 RepID=A0ABP8DI42_9ACTN
MTADPAQWLKQYEELRPQLEPLRQKLDALVRDLLEDAGIKVIQVESRAKTLESFGGKLESKGDKYSDPIHDVTDLVGLRVIAYYVEDVERIGDIVRNEFEVDETNSVMKGREYDPDRFGYRSDQYIVSLQENRSALPEWRRLPKIKWEIQVRTVLQHAWAAVEHKLYYKSVNDAPPEVRRRLFALSALFELADREFSGIRDAKDAIVRGVERDVTENNFDIPLTYTSLSAYLDTHQYPQDVRDALLQQGNAMTPLSHRRIIGSRRSDLGELLDYYNIESLAQFHEYLRTDIEPVLRTVGVFARPDNARYAFEDYLQEAVLIARNVDEDDFYSLGYSEREWPAYQTNRDSFRENGTLSS